MSPPRILHLLDDTTAGGVTRVVEYIMTSPELASHADHRVEVMDSKSRLLGRFDADVIVSHMSVKWRNLPIFAAMRWQNPCARMIHVEHSYTQEFVRLNVSAKRRFAALLRLSYGVFDTVVAVSDAQASWLSGSCKLSSQKLKVIRSCVDLSAFRALPPPQHSKTVIGAIGRLEPQKGFETLITAVRRSACSNLVLQIYGTGAEETALRNLAHGDPRIEFKGFFLNPVSAMAAIDVVAMPSRWEAYGLVGIEALAAGRTLLVNCIDGLNDHLAHGAIGVHGSSPNDWKVALEALQRSDCASKTLRLSDRYEADFIEGWRSVIQPNQARYAPDRSFFSISSK